MLNRKVLRKQISYIRNENMPSQSHSLQDIDIPTNLYTTINKELFLARKITLDKEKIMIFCTESNL